MIDILDSEILKLEKVTSWMQEQQKKGGVDLDAFRREAIHRFHEQGFIVDVLVYETNLTDVYAFEPVVKGRVEEKPFDFDQMSHEVVNNLLELPDQDKGVIKADAELARMERERKLGRGPKHKH